MARPRTVLAARRKASESGNARVDGWDDSTRPPVEAPLTPRPPDDHTRPRTFTWVSWKRSRAGQSGAARATSHGHRNAANEAVSIGLWRHHGVGAGHPRRPTASHIQEARGWASVFVCAVTVGDQNVGAGHGGVYDKVALRQRFLDPPTVGGVGDANRHVKPGLDRDERRDVAPGARCWLREERGPHGCLARARR